jgi:hypothetical protein
MDDAGNWEKKKRDIPPDKEVDPTKGRRHDDEERPLDEDTEGDVDPTKRKPVEPGTRQT